MADGDVFKPIQIAGLNGDPIKVSVSGPDTVKPGEQFSYTIRVLDKDGQNPFNPTGIDPSVAVAFQINSMKAFQWQIAPNPDSAGNLVCIIAGLAQDVEGVYIDKIRGYNTMQGLTFDPPVDELHSVNVTS